MVNFQFLFVCLYLIYEQHWVLALQTPSTVEFIILCWFCPYFTGYSSSFSWPLVRLGFSSWSSVFSFSVISPNFMALSVISSLGFSDLSSEFQTHTTNCLQASQNILCPKSDSWCPSFTKTGSFKLYCPFQKMATYPIDFLAKNVWFSVILFLSELLISEDGSLQ